MSQDIVGSIAMWAKAEEISAMIGKYTGYRENEEITVEIYDRPDGGEYRYTVNAYVTSEPARHGHGNGGPTISDALSTYHWNDLSRR
jgi:hypothetical protein